MVCDRVAASQIYLGDKYMKKTLRMGDLLHLDLSLIHI